MFCWPADAVAVGHSLHVRAHVLGVSLFAKNVWLGGCWLADAVIGSVQNPAHACAYLWGCIFLGVLPAHACAYLWGCIFMGVLDCYTCF